MRKGWAPPSGFWELRSGPSSSLGCSPSSTTRWVCAAPRVAFRLESMARRVSCLLGLAHMVWSLGPLFSCRLKVATEGRAIAVVGLEEALAEQASKATVHCTILWRREGLTSKEVQEVQAFANEWLQERGRSPEDVCHFSLEEWGHRSKLVEGELKDFVLEARKHFEAKWDLKPLEGRRGAVHVELHSDSG